MLDAKDFHGIFNFNDYIKLYFNSNGNPNDKINDFLTFTFWINTSPDHNPTLKFLESKPYKYSPSKLFSNLCNMA